LDYRVALIPGDGIGQEVIPAAVRVLEATGLHFDWLPAEAGWATFQRLGTALPAETLEAVRACGLALVGAVSSPARKVPGYRSPIVALRRELDLYANLRPAVSVPVAGSRPGIDLLLVRENTEGLYAGRERREGDEAVAERVITRRASERIGRLACRLAQARRGRLTIVHKANILPETCGLFRDTVRAVAEGFAGLAVDECLVDTMAMRLAQTPEAFDTIVTTNLFGDILSDEAAALLLEHIGEGEAAARVRRAVRQVLANGPHTADLGGEAGTQQVTQAAIAALSV
jgi:homoisocitrate dehydrogenase